MIKRHTIPNTQETLDALRKSSPIQARFDTPRGARRYTNPPYDGLGNLFKYVRESLTTNQQSTLTHAQFKRVLDAVNRFYDWNGMAPSVKQIQEVIPYV